MISYKINLTFDEQQALTMMEENETFDSFVGKEFIDLLNKHLEDKGLKGSAGFMHYAHVFNCEEEITNSTPKYMSNTQCESH